MNWWASLGTAATVAALLLAVFIWLATASDTSELRGELGAANQKLDDSHDEFEALRQQLGEWIHSAEEKSVGAEESAGAADTGSGPSTQPKSGNKLAPAKPKGLRPVSEIPPEHLNQLFARAKVSESDLKGGQKPSGPGNYNWHIVAKDGREWTVFFRRTGEDLDGY